MSAVLLDHELSAAEKQEAAEAVAEGTSTVPAEDNLGSTGGIIAQGASGHPAESTQLAAQAITGLQPLLSIFNSG